MRATVIVGANLCHKNDPPPGIKKSWEGWARLTVVSEACELRDLEPPLIADHGEPRS